MDAINNTNEYELATKVLEKLQQLGRTMAREGYSLQVEDRSLIDATPVFAVYKNDKRIARYRSLEGAEKWWQGQ